MLVLTAFYSVMVWQYYLYIKALCIVVFKGFKAVCGAGVACKDNDKVVECSVVAVGQVGCDDDRLVLVVVVCGGWIEN